MRKYLLRWNSFLLLFVLLLPLFCSFPVQAADSEAIHSIDIHIVLQQDGTARITETWDVTVNSGTEMYLVQGSLGAIEIRDFSVTDENGTVYENVGDWDVDWSFERKTNKCGINKTNSGLELCWGKGSYGRHTYKASYTMTNFVKAYSDDYFGFNQRIVNDQLSSVPENISAAIEVAGTTLSPEDTKIWAFGYPGEIYVQNGRIEAYSTDNLNKNSYMTILARFQPELFKSGYKTSRTFEQVKETAMSGSDYQSDSKGVISSAFDSMYLRLLLPTLLYLLFIILIPKFVRHRRNSSTAAGTGSSKSRIKTLPTASGAQAIPQLDYWRELPVNGNLEAVWYLVKEMQLGKGEGSLLGACLLRFMLQGCVRVEEHTKRELFGLSEKKEVAIVLCRQPADPVYAEIYSFFLKASKDDILGEKEFYRWSKRNYDKMESWINSFTQKGKSYLKGIGVFESVQQKVFFGLFNTQKDVYTQHGITIASQVKGFKNYLKDFTLLNEKQAADVHLWNDYLVFASLYGIADELAKQFKDIYPEYFQQTTVQGMNTLDTMIMFHCIDHMANQGARGMRDGRSAADSASSGDGGSSSSGGGGGSSGGGSGGGSR